MLRDDDYLQYPEPVRMEGGTQVPTAPPPSPSPAPTPTPPSTGPKKPM